MKFTKDIITMAALAALPLSAMAQGTLEDYNRAYALREMYADKQVYFHHVNPTWIGDSHKFWYVRNTPEGEKYVVVDADKSERTSLLDESKLASNLAKTSGKEVDSKKMGLQECSLNESQDTLRFTFAGNYWAYAIKDDKLEKTGAVPPPVPERHWMEVDDEKGGEPVTSPDEYTGTVNGENIKFEPLSVVKGNIIARVKYPTNESTLNGTNWTEAVAKLDDGTNNYYTKMFWDVRTSKYDHPANK